MTMYRIIERKANGSIVELGASRDWNEALGIAEMPSVRVDADSKLEIQELAREGRAFARWLTIDTL